MASLPDEILVEILSRVPFKSLCRFKCVSKAWRDLITDPLNSTRLPQAQALEGFFFVADNLIDYFDSDDGDDEDISNDRGSNDTNGDDGDDKDSGSNGDSYDLGSDDGDCEDAESDDGDGEDSSSDGGGENSDMDDGDGEDISSSSSDSGDDSHSDDGDGEDRSSDGGGDNSDSDDGDGEDSSSDGGNSDNLLCQIRVHFVDMFGRPLRPVDHCFPFLTELPGIENILLLNDCNGLLFGYIQESGKSLSRSYIESNPVTEQWVAVPVSHRKCTSLVFNPPASSHFHLVHIKKRDMIPVHIYSSKSGVWSPVRCDWGDLRIAPGLGSAYANGMLYVVLYEGDQIAVMDVEGNTRKIIPVPFQEGGEFQPCSLASPNSQGHLHLIYHADLGHGEILPEQQSNELFIWVLEDYDILI
ncbi:hypothetical protein SORBI_3002G060450 [Sorghum bicolor]|uniref:F-box domain-containing protein n=1 Tax=Sorghum bicolor TaxID=4558 RepID=A0A1W0W2G6_SORBI|nr:hypothetical protein SORBI_3002G060450 [Sorghum bicolor]